MDDITPKPETYKPPHYVTISELVFSEYERGIFHRINGFQQPLNMYQVMTFFTFAILLAYVFGYLAMKWMFAYTFLFLAPFTTCVILVILLATLATKKNPVDEWAFLHLEPNGTQKIDQIIMDSGEISIAQCEICDIIHTDSKHCVVCNKCVRNFDHHCIWLNTCIGMKNYWSFFLLILAFTVFILLIICWTLYDIIFTSFDSSEYIPNERIFTIKLWDYIIPGLALLICIILLILVLPLLVFHIQLILANSSTHAYITNQRDQYRNEIHDNIKRSMIDWVVINRKKLKNSRNNQLPSLNQPSTNQFSINQASSTSQQNLACDSIKLERQNAIEIPLSEVPHPD